MYTYFAIIFSVKIVIEKTEFVESFIFYSMRNSVPPQKKANSASKKFHRYRKNCHTYQVNSADVPNVLQGGIYYFSTGYIEILISVRYSIIVKKHTL